MLDHDNFFLPETGIPEEQRKARMGEFSAYIESRKHDAFGYQVNQNMDYREEISPFLSCHVNNVGDPFYQGNYMMNSKVMEQAVLDYYARLWNAKLPHNPKDPESYWGYVLTMGSSEGNLYGLWSARDYLMGKKLVVDKTESASPKATQHNYRLRSIHPRAHHNKHAYTPVAFFSQDTHYSVVKAVNVLQIPTYDLIGNSLYPGENPLREDGRWLLSEVPSKEGNGGPGCMDIDALATLVEFFASRGFPILVNCNYGSTFKGAYDDVEEIGKRLMPIFERYGLAERNVEYDHHKHLADTRTGYWIHVDGALGAAYMPFMEMGKKRGVPDIPACGPSFDFRLPWVHSIVMSGHKWPGAPWPCGIYMTKVKYQVSPPDDPEYIGSPDSTFAGSRNGLSAVVLWNHLAKNSYDSQIETIRRSQVLAQYAEEQLQTVGLAHPGLDMQVERTPLSLTIRFRKPNDELVGKYSLSCETLTIEGQNRNYAHIFVMGSVSRQLIDALVADLKQPEAFSEVSEEPVRDQRARGMR